MPTITYNESQITRDVLNVSPEQWLEIKAKYGKPLARQIREQLEREGMTVKQILARSATEYGPKSYTPNILTPREATRRHVERAAEIVRERQPSERKCDVSAWYEAEDSFHAAVFNAFTIGELKMQSKDQWHLLRDVIGDEGLKELIQK